MMILRRAVLLLLTLLYTLSGWTQTPCDGEIHGIVLDEHDHPVVAAAVYLTPGGIGKMTDSEGKFHVSGLCDERYSLRIQLLGFDDFATTVKVNGKMQHVFRLKEDVTQLQEVVVQHHDDFHTEHATNFTVVTERELAKSAGKSIGESLKTIAGVSSIQTGPGIFKPVIHGVHSQRILVLNHGIRHEGQQWGAEHAPEIDPFIASNIVVVKDASAIKYGTDALGGVVIVNPPALPEQHRLAGTLASVLQSNGRSAAISGMLEGGIKNHDGWGWRIQATGKKTGDFHTPDYHLTNTAIRELNFSSAVGYHREKFGLDFFFSRFQSEIGILKGTAIGNLDDLVIAMERAEPLFTRDFSYNIEEPRQSVSHNLFKLNGHVNVGSGEWRFQYGFQNNNRREYDIRIGNLSYLPSIDLRLNTHSFDGEWESHHAASGTIAIGVNGIYQVNANIPGTQRIPFIPNFRNLTGGVYAVSKFNLGRLSVDAGARYDFRHNAVKGYDVRNTYYSTDMSFNNVSASLGVSRKFDAVHRLTFNISSSWRPPHVAELFSVGTHQSAAAIESGLLLDEETSEVMNLDDISFRTEQALKIVATYGFRTENTSVEITPYANYIFNYIFLRPHGITKNVRGVYPYFRYDQTDALFLGADIDAIVRLHDNFTLSPRLSLLKATDRVNDDYFVFVPSSRFDLDLRYERSALFGLSNVYLESNTRMVMKQRFAPRVVTVSEIKEAEEQGVDIFESDRSIFDFKPAPEGYMLLNVATGFSIKNEKVQYDIRLAAENLLNTTYREYTNRFRYYADDVGRNFILSVKCIF